MNLRFTKIIFNSFLGENKVAAELWPFVNFRRSALSSDANFIKYNMVYLNMNVLSNVPYSYGTLICFGDATHAVQLYTPAIKSDPNIYFRQCTDATWSSWMSLKS